MAAIGLRARTGRAVAVILAGSSGTPRGVMRRELTLTSPVMPATLQPYHDVMELPWKRARVRAREAEFVIEAVATEAIREILLECRSRGLEVTGLGVVGSPDRDLEAIGNPHIRAHAAEGILFRRALEVAAERNGLGQIREAESGLEARAASELGLPLSTVKARLAEFGTTLGRPWRVDERTAAAAAWLALAGCRASGLGVVD